MRYLAIVLMLFTSFKIDKNKLLEEYSIDQIYSKVELDSGTLNEDGEEIDFIFTEDQIKAGRYEVSITDGPGDLYEIKGTDYFIKFIGYYGYAGHGEEGLLIINSYGTGKFTKYED
ncbi:hypothetical protein [Sphingobacterium paludis]|uniref:Uncharacterized protein n=1 Tax=Sphingobacterium paludis TaxID=1476465 RepID=A0A4R7D1U5_9SPHI|nr:hypothetical protein [Sphingobacterium paludis]TDS14949.1 hypothetical protein B0I21_103451 [Sphingobacterium paludis]